MKLARPTYTQLTVTAHCGHLPLQSIPSEQSHAFLLSGTHPADTRPLCSPPLSTYLRGQAAQLATRLSESASLPRLNGSSTARSTAAALGTSLFEITWAAHFEVHTRLLEPTA